MDRQILIGMLQRLGWSNEKTNPVAAKVIEHFVNALENGTEDAILQRIEGTESHGHGVSSPFLEKVAPCRALPGLRQ